MVDWVEEFPGMISVCDFNGIILDMNKLEAEFFESSGGKALIGTSLFDCHSKKSGDMIKAQMADQKARVYTSEEDGKKEIILQVPWYRGGVFAGLVEIALPIEGEIVHLIR